MESGEATITFKRGEDEISMMVSDVTAYRLASYFKLNHESLYLKEEFGSMVKYSNAEGRFNFSGSTPFTTFEVKGNEITPEMESQERGMAMQVPHFSATHAQFPSISYGGVGIPRYYGNVSTSKGRMSSSFPSAASLLQSHNQEKAFQIKIVRADLSSTGKPGNIMYHNKQVHITVSKPADANVNFITESARRKFSSDNIVIVGSNGIQIDDEEETKDVRFWKGQAKKFYAVVPPKNKRRRSSGKSFRRLEQDESNSEEDTIYETRSKRKNNQLEEINEKVQRLVEASAVPQGLLQVIQNSMQCLICRVTPISPPAMVARCCKSIIGCEECVLQWYGTEKENLDKSCPKCGLEHARSETFKLCDLDAILRSVEPISYCYGQ